MANDLNNGAERLLARILTDAEAQAAQTAQAAQAEVDKVKELAGQEVAAAAEEAKARAARAAQDVLERSRTNAELDSRKYALAAKRGVVEEAFKAAFDALCAAGGQERDALLTAMAVREALGGEKVAPAKADVDNMKRLLGAVNAELAKAGKAELTLDAAAEGIDGGFMLRGDGYEKNCSFEAMLRDVREAEESQVAQLLFG